MAATPPATARTCQETMTAGGTPTGTLSFSRANLDFHSHCRRHLATMAARGVEVQDRSYIPAIVCEGLAIMRMKCWTGRLAVMVLSAGWVVPLFALLTIPANMMMLEAYWLTREAEAARKFAEVTAPGAEPRKDVLESAKMEVELVRKQRSLYPDRQRERLGYYEVAAIILCAWLGLVAAFWAWRLFPPSREPSTLE